MITKPTSYTVTFAFASRCVDCRASFVEEIIDSRCGGGGSMTFDLWRHIEGAFLQSWLWHRCSKFYNVVRLIKIASCYLGVISVSRLPPGKASINTARLQSFNALSITTRRRRCI